MQDRRVCSAAGSWHASAKDTELWTATGELYGARLLACEWRTPGPTDAQVELSLDSCHVERDAFILTNDPAVHALTAWRTYTEGAPGALAHQLLHIVRTTAPGGSLRRAQPDRLRTWLLRLPGRMTRRARRKYVQLVRDEPLRKLLPAALRSLTALQPLAAA
jgi:hypothetical protein